MDIINVSIYSLQTASGRRIRYATRVQIGGRTVDFMEPLSKREAIRQAQAFLAR